MTEPEDHTGKEQPDETVQDAANIQDLVGGLDFVPGWAKGDSSESGAKIHKQFENKRGPSRGRGGRDGRKPRQQSSGGRDRFAQKKRDSGDQRQGGRRDGQRRNGRNFERRDSQPRLPVTVSFIPERDRLGAIVKQLHSLKRAFPLPYIAGLFLTKPEYHLIKLEVKASDKESALQFYQCKKSRAVFLSQEELLDYVVRTHLEEHFERVEVDVEAPSGNFVCVGRCKRSGVLIGPPNYHGYNERVAEVHRSRFSHMSFDDYRNNIEMVREPEVIEQWKESCKTKCLYRPKDEQEAEATLTLAQVEKLFIEKFAPQYMQSGTKVILPASLLGTLSSRPLVATIRAAGAREERFPLSLMLALRPAFRRMRLHLMKAGKNETYVIPAPPKPLDAEHAIPEIKKTVEIITAHPGCTKKILINELFPGKTAGDKEVVDELDSLAWLIDKGHIIEFFNGTFAIPGHLRDPGVVPREMPQAHHHEEAKKSAAAAKPVTKKAAEKEEAPSEPAEVKKENPKPSEANAEAKTEAADTEKAEEPAGAVSEANEDADADQVETV